MTFFVLVHGGWHDGSCWERVVPLLRAGGHEVRAPTLAGAPAGLAEHVAEVVEALLAGPPGPAVLVGHSAGGAVVTGAAQRAPERLAGVADLDAFVPEPGQSVLDLLRPERRAHFLALVRDGEIVLDPDAAMDGWAVRDPSDRAWLAPRLRPHPLGALADPLPPGPVPVLPRQYVHCTDKPGGDSFAGFAAAAQADPGWRFDVLATGHDAMLTAPRELAAVLLDTWG